MNKEVFRKKQINLLTQFSKTKKKIKEDKILLDKFINSSLLKNAQNIGVTISMPNEVDTSSLIVKLWDMGKDVFIPRCLPGHKMEFTHYTYQTELERTKFGTWEDHSEKAQVDNDLDLIVVPGTAFSASDHQRLGFGGGYYDRFLTTKNYETVSLVNSKQFFEEPQWPVEKYDIPIKNFIYTD